MKKILKNLYLIVVLLSSCSLAVSLASESSFIVNKITFTGLERISTATANNYLPIKRGERLNINKTSMMIHALYRTGFFKNIRLSRQGHTLLIHVVEQPTITELTVTGNSVIATDKLKKVMASLGVAAGQAYPPAKLMFIKQSLLNQYYQLGYYNATVNIRTTPIDTHRLIITLQISEGVPAKIKHILIIGNHVFNSNTLIKASQMQTSNLFTVFTKSDRFSEEKLAQGLENLRHFYLDHGYLRFNIRSTQTEMTPDRKSMVIVILIDEGQQYKVNQCHLIGMIPFSTQRKLLAISPGEIFSRHKMILSEEAIKQFLGEEGYLLPSIHVEPTINDTTAEISLVFNVSPGEHTYVRTITFENNQRTNDNVLRRELTQLEAAPASLKKLTQSKQRLNLLPYIREATMTLQPVPHRADQIDVNYHVVEESAAQASLHIGYSQLYRTILGASMTHQNFLGTGKTVGINLSHSRYEQFYSFDYTDPYYTPTGISRTLSLSISRVDPKGGGIDNGYTTYEYNASILYGIPIGREEAGALNQLQAGAAYQDTLVNLAQSGVSEQVSDFINRYGRRFHELVIKLGWSRNGLDKAIFPTSGTLQTLFLDAYAPVSHHALNFYTLTYQGKYYFPLTEQFILLSRLELGYGIGRHGIVDFPFFKNYFAGGLNSVRGYQGNTLGPRDSNGKPLGGNLLVDGSIGLIFPNYISDNLRTNIFLDAGNVYNIGHHHHFGGQSQGAGSLRYSVGLEADWLTPVGPVSLSFAVPIHKHSNDYHESFQFALGANF